MGDDFELQVGSVLVGAAAGAMVSLASASRQVAADVRQRQRNMNTIANWSHALDAARTRATKAERDNVRLREEVARLRKSLGFAQAELSLYRNA